GRSIDRNAGTFGQCVFARHRNHGSRDHFWRIGPRSLRLAWLRIARHLSSYLCILCLARLHLGLDFALLFEMRLGIKFVPDENDDHRKNRCNDDVFGFLIHLRDVLPVVPWGRGSPVPPSVWRLRLSFELSEAETFPSARTIAVCKAENAMARASGRA